jgi:hypothetical protein
MIPSLPPSSSPISSEGAATLVLPAAAARFQCALYFQLLSLAERVLKQYRREQL